jgi:hypothetical protein
LGIYIFCILKAPYTMLSKSKNRITRLEVVSNKKSWEEREAIRKKLIRDKATEFEAQGSMLEMEARSGRWQSNPAFSKNLNKWENDMEEAMGQYDKSYAMRIHRPDVPVLNEAYYKQFDPRIQNQTLFEPIREKLRVLRKIIDENR